MTPGGPDFVFAEKMRLGTRLAVLAGLAAAGIALQMLASVLWGWMLVFAAALLAAVRGQSNEPRWKGPGEWQNVTMDELKQVEELVVKGRKALGEAGVFSTTSAAGCAMSCLLLVGVGLVTAALAVVADRGISADTVLLPVIRGGSVALLFAVDALTMLTPLWLFGRVRAWEPPNLRVRVKQLTGIYEMLSSNAGFTFQPSLMVRKTEGGSAPVDCRLTVGIRDADPDFMGIQVQTSLNSVEGKTYPYTYCVLLARPAFGLLDKAKRFIETPPASGFRTGLFSDSNEKKEAKFARYKDSLVELGREGDVEIVVVRQNTKGSGYHTTPQQAAAVFHAALALAKQVLQP